MCCLELPCRYQRLSFVRQVAQVSLTLHRVLLIVSSQGAASAARRAVLRGPVSASVLICVYPTSSVACSFGLGTGLPLQQAQN